MLEVCEGTCTVTDIGTTLRGLRNRPLGGDSVGRCSTVKPSGKNLSENKKSTQKNHRRMGRTLRFSIFLFSFSSFFCSYLSRWQRVSFSWGLLLWRDQTLQSSAVLCGQNLVESTSRREYTSNAMGLVAFPIAAKHGIFCWCPQFPCYLLFFPARPIYLMLDTCWVWPEMIYTKPTWPLNLNMMLPTLATLG